MKKYIKYIMVVPLLLIIASCTNLDEDIFSSIPKDEFFKSEEQMVKYSARAYMTLQEWGTEQSWQTLDMQVGNECCVPTNPTNSWKETRYKELQTHDFPVSNKLIRTAWDFCFDGIAACNDVIYEIEKSPIEFDGKNRVLAEMKTLRAFYYFLAADAYGNIPFSIDKTSTDYPEQKDRLFIFQFIEKEILDNIDYLANENTPLYYGRITRGAANTLLAKLYLNAQVWLNQPMWDKAEKAAKDVIDSKVYIIEDDFKSNFTIHNESSREAILSIPYSSVYTDSDHNAFCLFVLTLSSRLAQALNISDAWDGFVGQPDFIASFDENDIRKKATYLYGQMYGANGQPIEGYIIEPMFSESKYNSGRNENEGAILGKWEFQTDGLLKGNHTSMENDCFIFRYADVVLMYVEALVRQGKISEAAAVPDFQKIRKRAGLEPFTTGSLDIEAVYNERSHEMALEGWRRNDMIRFGKYQDSWWAKPDKTPDYKLLFPIPEERKNSNPKLNQNTGY